MAGWDKKRIKAALLRRFDTLKDIEMTYGLPSGSISTTFLRQYPAVEEVIASILKARPEEIWPDRYEDGEPKRKRGRYPFRRPERWRKPGPKSKRKKR